MNIDVVVLKSIGGGYYQEGIVDDKGEFTPSEKRPIKIAHDNFPISVPPVHGEKMETTFNLTEYLEKGDTEH